MNILIVGYGSIGSRHCKLLRQLYPNADIRILRHKHHGSIPDYATDVFYSIDEALKFNPSFAVICNPASQHIPISMHLAKEKINLLIEKPISDTLANLSEFCKIVTDSKIKVMVGYNLRFLDSLIKFKSLLQNNFIGEVHSAYIEATSYLPNWRPNIDYRNSVSSQKKLGGGVLLELSHEIDYIKWIFGDVKWVKGNISKLGNLDIDVEDSAHVWMEIEKQNKSKVSIILNLNFISRVNTRFCKVIGSQGMLLWDGLTNSILYCADNENSFKVIHNFEKNIEDTYLKELQYFIKCLHENKEPLISLRDSMEVLSIIEAIKQSSQNDEIIFL